MKKLVVVACLSLATVGMASGQAFALGCGCRKCGCCYKFSICCRPYNAFSPICCGNLCCDGCCGCCCQPPCGCSLHLGCNGHAGPDCSCLGHLPAHDDHGHGPAVTSPAAPAASPPVGPMPTPLPKGAPAGPTTLQLPAPAYFGPVQNATYQPAYYGGYGMPMGPYAAYGYGHPQMQPAMMPPMGMPMGGMPGYGYAGYNPRMY
jgi:hypothetical protein